MTIQAFATDHRLKVTKDTCDDPAIMGRIGQSNIYEYSADELGVMFITDGKKEPRTQTWNKFKAACLGAGMTIHQSGDAEGAFSFDPTNKTQARVAIKGIKARVKRQMTPEQASAGAARLAKYRFLDQKPLQEAVC
jgi:hypothetical protein